MCVVVPVSLLSKMHYFCRYDDRNNVDGKSKRKPDIVYVSTNNKLKKI